MGASQVEFQNASLDGRQTDEAVFSAIPDIVPTPAPDGYAMLVPGFPATFVMANDVEIAKARIFCPDFHTSNSSVGIISGSSATGKTSVAIGLARDADIRQVYSDGVIWVNCGAAMTPHSLLVTLHQIVRAVQEADEALKEDRGNSKAHARPMQHLVQHNSSIKGVTNEVVKRLAGKQHLLVLDDVCDLDIVRACRPCGADMLVTTSQLNYQRALRVLPMVCPDQKSFGSMITEYSVRCLSHARSKTLLNVCFDCQSVPQEVLDQLYAAIGRLPLELCLLSLLLHLVQVSLQMDPGALVKSVVKKLGISHNQLQTRISTQVGASQLSRSHLYCWRTIAVILDVLPNMYRYRVLQLAKLQRGESVTRAELQHLWGVPDKDVMYIIDTLERVCILTQRRTVLGPMWCVCNLPWEYIMYWAKIESPAAPINTFRESILSSVTAVYSLCNPFRDTGHLKLLPLGRHEPETVAVMRAAGKVSDKALADACTVVLGVSVWKRQEACTAITLAAAMGELEEIAVAHELMERVYAWFKKNTRSSDPVQTQIKYTLALLLLKVGKGKAGMLLLEECLKQVKGSPAFRPTVMDQIYTKAIAAAYEVADLPRIMWFSDQQCVFVHENIGPSAHYVHTMIERVQAQFHAKVNPQRIMQSIKATQTVLDKMPNSYNLLHLRLKMCAVAYKLAVGKYVDMQIMLCYMFRRVQSLYDANHEIVISLMSEIGVCLNVQGNFRDALDIFKETIALVKHPKTMTALSISIISHSNLAVSLLALGHPQRALTSVRRVSHLIKKVPSLGITHWPTQYAWAAALVQMEEYVPAKELLQDLILHYTSREARSLIATSAILETMGSLCMLEQDWSAAGQNFLESIQVSELLQKERPARQINLVESGKAHYLVSIILKIIGKPDQAEKHVSQWRSIYKEHKDHPFMLWAQQADSWEEQFLASVYHTTVPPATRVLLSDPGKPELDANGSALAK